MKRLIQILTLPTIFIGFSVTMTVYAWGMTTKEFIIPYVWVATIIGFVLSFVNYKIGLISLIITSLAWLTIFADNFGHFLTFDFFKIQEWGLQIPFIICPVVVSSLAIRQLITNSKFQIIGILLTILIPAIGFASYFDKTITQTTFSEFHGLDNHIKTYMGRFRATPMDTRYFEVTMGSQEVRKVAKQVGTFLIDHYYVNDTELKVKMRFNKVMEVELYKLKDIELKRTVKWELKELDGETEYLKK
jgi:hypothetical protein